MIKFQRNALAAIVLLIWGLALFKLWLVGDLPKLVNPKYLPFIIISAGLSVLMSIVLFYRKEDRGHSTIIRSSIFLVPAVIAIFMRPSVLTGSDTLQRVGITPPVLSADSVLDARNAKAVILDGAAYYPVISDMFENPSEYSGKKISITGMVLVSRSASDKADFAVARMMMLCCAADVSAVGIPCHWEYSPRLVHRAWYTVTGTIGVKKLDGSDVPYVDVEDAVPAKKPSQEYFYPF
jgi:uncharacterized repeat protein (TIGR03943 family)